MKNKNNEVIVTWNDGQLNKFVAKYPNLIDEVEEAANDKYPGRNITEQHQNKAFKAGVEWYKERSANEAIEFNDWACFVAKRRDEKHWIYQGEFITTKKLYELWQQKVGK